MPDEKKPDLTPETAPEPVDTAAAMQYFEAAEAAAEVGREILASRKPKKPKKQKKQKKEPEQASPAPVETDNGWQPSQQETPAEPKKTGKPEKAKKVKKAKKAEKKKPAEPKPKKLPRKHPSPDGMYRWAERYCSYIGLQLLREYHALRRTLGHVIGEMRRRLPALWHKLRSRSGRRAEHFADEVLFPYRILSSETGTLIAALRDKTPEGKAGRRDAWRDYGLSLIHI